MRRNERGLSRRRRQRQRWWKMGGILRAIMEATVVEGEGVIDT